MKYGPPQFTVVLAACNDLVENNAITCYTDIAFNSFLTGGYVLPSLPSAAGTVLRNNVIRGSAAVPILLDGWGDISVDNIYPGVKQ